MSSINVQLGTDRRPLDDFIDTNVLHRDATVEVLKVYVETHKTLLTNDQRLVYDSVVEHVSRGNGEILVSHAPVVQEKRLF